MQTAPTLTMPTRPLVGGRHKYVPAACTDIRKTFEKFQRAARIAALQSKDKK